MLARHGFDPDDPETLKLARVVRILCSSPVYLDQVDAPRDEAIDDIAWAVRTLTRAAREP
jgi:hypothetical protein